jgi:hypothetical protein
MNGSKDHRSSDASDKPERGDTVLSLQTVQRMLPLVQRIVDDVLGSQKALKRLEPEEEVLDRNKRTLSWPQRQRRYQVKDELSRTNHDLSGALTELRELGVVLLDLDHGLVGFPTMVNNRRAFFSWHPGEQVLQYWTFADEETRRPIPQSWFKEVSLSGKS